MNINRTPLPYFTLEIAPRDSRAFKSIRNVIWRDIPEFAILTGRNGSGKSQLLFYLAHALNQATDAQFPDLENLQLTVKGASFEPGDVSYVRSAGEYIYEASLSIANLQNVKKQAFDSSRGHNVSIQGRSQARWMEKNLGPNFRSLSETDFIKSAPDDFSFMIEDHHVIYGLTHVFLAHRLQTLVELEKGTSREIIEKNLGPAPWIILNQILSAAEFPYNVEPPTGSLLEHYRFELKEANNTINPQDLSSGEKVILQLALWLYNSKHHKRFPALLILDEPDAHLHPSMTRQFLNVLREVLVNQYNVRVILATHSPSTVALAPDGSTFEMTRGSSEIVASSSKASAVGILTSGMIVVSPMTKFVLVEDDLDVAFCGVVAAILTDCGPSRDAMALAPAPSIVFLPASVGRGKDKISGGKDNVRQWIAKLDSAPFDQVVRGLIDRDTGNTSAERIFVLDRYSIENYMLDPFVVFGILLESGSAHGLTGISITGGDEHLIRDLPKEQLQLIVGYVQKRIEPEISDLDEVEKLMQTMDFTNGVSLCYPKWMIDRRGHSLLPLFQKALGGADLISPPRLLKMMQRVRLIPKDLATLFLQLQIS